MKRTLLTMILATVVCLLIINQTTEQGRARHQSDDDEAQVMKVDEEFRVAKLKNDTTTLDRILADSFYETNQNGNTRNKVQFVELFTEFKIASLDTVESQVRVTGVTGVVTGSQTETNARGLDRMLFMRVYVKGNKGWQLLASMQFRSSEANIQFKAEPKVL
ncbi:MAG: nuclear transport factor 2 family protein [Acidobacteria bacterium]|nr:nuclear transport factor 2 family protein [Acidobacteriota bacterium]